MPENKLITSGFRHRGAAGVSSSSSLHLIPSCGAKKEELKEA